VIPQSFIQDLLNRIDIVELVGRYVQLKKGGANYIGLCPFHNEKSPSFSVSPTKQFYHCFGCGVHGTAISFLIEYSGLSFVDAVKDLAQAVGMQVPDQDRMLSSQHVELQAKSLVLTDVMAKASDFYRQQLKNSQVAIEYLKGRGLSGEIAAKFCLGFAPDKWDNLRTIFANYEINELVEAGLVIEKSDKEDGRGKRYDRFRGRIMFPIRNIKGQVIGFGGRVLDSGEPKYLNSPETPLFQKGNELYGLFEARQAIRNAGYVLVTEGYMDVVALSQFGFPQAVATLGTACTSIHIQKLLRQTDHVIFSFDGDSAGYRAARRALEACLPHITDNKILKFLFLPQEHDPDSYIRELGPSLFEQKVHEAMPLSQFLLKEVVSGQDLTSLEGRAAAQFNAKPLLHAMAPSALRLQIVRELAHLTHTPPFEMESLLDLSHSVIQVKNAPPRAKRTAPLGLERQVMKVLLAQPALVSVLDEDSLAAIKQLAPDNAEMFQQLISACQRLGSKATFALLTEQLREEGADFSSLIAEIAADSDPDFDAVRLELVGAIRQAKMQKLKGEMESLIASGLMTDVSRMRYRELAQQQEQLRKQNVSEGG